MKYLSHVRNKQFTYALACLSPNLRYLTVQRRWYALRLGLYNTILRHTFRPIIRSRRHKVVTTIAAIKRQDLDENEAQAAIANILNQKRYANFRTEFIKETATAYPETVFGFLEKNIANLESSYYQGLYLGLLQQYYPTSHKLTSYLDKFLADKSQFDYADGYCLYNNISLHDTQAKLANLNQIFAYYKLASINILDNQGSFTVTNLKSEEPRYAVIKTKYNEVTPRVTVVVTAYNASKTINSCIDSLVQQSWPNIEIIVVDDASTDDTLFQLQRLSAKHSALKVVALPKNTGTFAAKSIGAKYATGEFLTCQDSDDWAHPQKIAEQVQPLIDDANLIATTSHWLRLDDEGQYYVRQVYPFMRQNPASPMFRLSKVKKEIGLWHIVRTGADSEFYERLKLLYGEERITTIKKPLTIASHRPNSLMTSEEFGIYKRTGALSRLDYWEAWRLWHIDSLYRQDNPFIPSVQQQAHLTKALFRNVPDSIKVSLSDLRFNLAKHRVLSEI